MISDYEKVKLLIPGWGGELTPEEVSYIKTCLNTTHRKLRTKWGFIRGVNRRPNDEGIIRVAMSGYAPSVKETSSGLTEKNSPLKDGIEHQLTQQ